MNNMNNMEVYDSYNGLHLRGIAGNKRVVITRSPISDNDEYKDYKRVYGEVTRDNTSFDNKCREFGRPISSRFMLLKMEQQYEWGDY